jgi:hypothetical protein
MQNLLNNNSNCMLQAESDMQLRDNEFLSQFYQWFVGFSDAESSF